MVARVNFLMMKQWLVDLLNSLPSPRSRNSFPFALGAPIYKDDDDGEQRKGSSASGVPYYIFIIIFLERVFFFFFFFEV